MGESNYEEMNRADLQLCTVHNREIYTAAIKKFLHAQGKQRYKSLEKGILNEIECSETVTIPEMNVSAANFELDLQHKKLETDVKIAMKEQIRIMIILNKILNCPISQKVNKL